MTGGVSVSPAHFRQPKSPAVYLRDLGAETSVDVDFAFRPAPVHRAQYARAKGQLTEVVAYYQDPCWTRELV